MNITVYSTNCPNCKLLEDYLEKKGLDYEKISDVDVMLEKGCDHVPMVELDGVVMEMDAAMLRLGGVE